jgi:hypothetical protein
MTQYINVTAIIIKNNVRHHELDNFKSEFLQATTVKIENLSGSVVVSSIYCFPKHIIASEQFEAFFTILGDHFIVISDYNVKH